jgi:release factor glutamine methyltransferase
LGTGSGAITLALVSQMPEHIYFATDCSFTATRLAKHNSARHHFEDKIHFFCADWLAPVKANRNFFDVIVSNPPYIKTESIADLQPEIYKYEPVTALDGGPDGFGSFRRIINTAHQHLNKGGWLFMEIGYDQKDPVSSIVNEDGHYSQAVFTKDYSGCDRVVYMRKK